MTWLSIIKENSSYSAAFYLPCTLGVVAGFDPLFSAVVIVCCIVVDALVSVIATNCISNVIH